jgi:hypothetical protein
VAVVAAGVVLIGLAQLVLSGDLDRADKIASVVGAFVGVIGLAVSGYAIMLSRSPRSPAQPTVAAPYPARPRTSATGPIVVAAVFLGICVVGALAALLVTLIQIIGDGDGTGNGATPASKGAGSTPDRTAPAPVLWKDEIRLDDTPRDYDYEPPRRGNTSTDLSSDGYLSGSRYHKFWGAGVVTWTAKGDPTRDQCAERLTTHGVDDVPVHAKSRFCLQTNEGRVVYVKVSAREDDGYRATVTIWGAD